MNLELTQAHMSSTHSNISKMRTVPMLHLFVGGGGPLDECVSGPPSPAETLPHRLFFKLMYTWWVILYVTGEQYSDSQ